MSEFRFRTNGQNFIKYTCFDTHKITVGIVTCHFFATFVTELLPMIGVKNIVSAQHHENKSTAFHQILYMRSY